MGNKMITGKESEHWDRVAQAWSANGYANELLAEHKKKVYLDLVNRWTDIAGAGTILKTDLFAEAFGLEQFIFDISGLDGNLVGIDISSEIVSKAREQAGRHGVDTSRFCCCDVRQLPMPDNSVDLVISDSSLDHFPSEADIVAALKELARVLREGGVLFLSLDNKKQLSYPPYFITRAWMKFGLSPYFIGKTLSPSRLEQTLREIGFSVEEMTTILHYPHPDSLIRWLEYLLRKVSRCRLDNLIRRGLAWLDGLGEKRTRYLTGRYITVKAVKKRMP